jgi:hypothetical protein
MSGTILSPSRRSISIKKVHPLIIRRSIIIKKVCNIKALLSSTHNWVTILTGQTHSMSLSAGLGATLWLC